MNSEEDKSLQDKMNRVLERLRPESWKAIWSPDPSQKVRGRVLRDCRKILIFDAKRDEAWKTFLHELIEIVFEPVFSKYRTRINQQIEAFEKDVHDEKERAIERLVPFIQEEMGEE